MSLKPFSTLIWAFDPFEQTEAVQSQIAVVLKQILARFPVRVTPVHVLSWAELDREEEEFEPWLDHTRRSVEKTMADRLSRLAIPGIDPPHVLVIGAAGLRPAVNEIVDYARKHDAGLIVAGTHGRHGFSRLVKGSFAETLASVSPIPTLVAGPHSRFHSQGRILFPSDLGAHSRGLFEYVVGIASRLGAKVTVLHVTPSPFEPVIQSGMYLLGGGWVPIHEFIPEEREQRQKLLLAWSRWASYRGVEVDTVLLDPGPNVADAIVEHGTDPRYALVAMGANSGPWAAQLLGSISRQVIRRANCPVWILHPRGRRVGQRVA
jgi:nucleotide-binding universal stress UspA family protein